MLQPKKFVIGIQPSSKLFRLTSLGGIVVDKFLELRGSKLFDDKYFTGLTRNIEAGNFILKSEDDVNIVNLDPTNIIFTKDYYASDKKINLEKFIDEIQVMWKTLNEVLHIKDIRRIGIVAEHRIEFDRKIHKSTPSKILLDTYTHFDTSNCHPAKLQIQFENRMFASDGGVPDIKKSDFINIIKTYYDSELDGDHSTTDCLNANIDVQRYFSPLLNGNVHEEIIKLSNRFELERKNFVNDLEIKGIA